MHFHPPQFTAASSLKTDFKILMYKTSLHVKYRLGFNNTKIQNANIDFFKLQIPYYLQEYSIEKQIKNRQDEQKILHIWTVCVYSESTALWQHNHTGHTDI